MAPDGLSYGSPCAPGPSFHNGEPVTGGGREVLLRALSRHLGGADEGARGGVETPDDRRVRFVLKKPWPDFLTFYSSATGAGWIVPKKYVQQVGEDGYKKAPVGAAPTSSSPSRPGVELVFEAFDGYWRKVPAVQRLVFKVVPERRRGWRRSSAARSISPTPSAANSPRNCRSRPPVTEAGRDPGHFWLYFPDQWDPKSPWHDQRVRDAARLAIDYSRSPKH